MSLINCNHAELSLLCHLYKWSTNGLRGWPALRSINVSGVVNTTEKMPSATFCIMLLSTCAVPKKVAEIPLLSSLATWSVIRLIVGVTTRAVFLVTSGGGKSKCSSQNQWVGLPSHHAHLEWPVQFAAATDEGQLLQNTLQVGHGGSSLVFHKPWLYQRRR